jgi:hypothetical protein
MSAFLEVRAQSSTVLARAHGWFNIAGGAWPLLHLRSFEAVLGPKQDRWLVQTVAGLMLCNGFAQVTTGTSHEGLLLARRIGIGTALTLATIDLVYAPAGRISKVCLLDALAEAGWIVGWLATSKDGL